jgi:hypothetical protein
MPTSYKYWPWSLQIIIAKHSLTGNSKYLNSNRKSYGIILSGILGIDAVSPFAYSVKIMASVIKSCPNT